MKSSSGSKRFENTYRFTWKHFGRKNRAPSFTCQWAGRGTGRWWKRKLSKVRRRAWKDVELRGRRVPRGVDGIETECNYKTW